MQRVHSEENYTDLIHLTGPVRYVVISRLSLILILPVKPQKLRAWINILLCF